MSSATHVPVPTSEEQAQQQADEEGVSPVTHAPLRPSNISSLVCAFMAALTTGATTYAFGLYGAALKKTLHLSQGQLDTVSTWFFCAGLLSWMPGLLADRLGPRTTMACGGTSGACALLLYWALATQWLVPPRALLVPCLSGTGVLIFLSSACVTGSVFKIMVSTCGPGSKGSAVGVAKGYVGLGVGTYAAIFAALKRPHESDLDFLPMAAFFAFTCSTLPALLLLPHGKDVVFSDDTTPNHFRVLYASLLLMGLWIVGTTLAALLEEDDTPAALTDQHDDATSGGPYYARGFFLIVLWLGPILALLCLPRRRQMSSMAHTRLGDNGDDHEGDGIIREDEIEGTHAPSGLDQDERNESVVIEEGVVIVKKDSSDEGENNDEEEEVGLLTHTSNTEASETHSAAPPTDLPLHKMLQTPSAQLMLWTTTILVGAGTVETNNMGQMVEALGMDPKVASASLALFSVAQAAARVATGALSEAALTSNLFGSKGIPRPFFLVVAASVAVVAHAVLGLATSQFVFVLGATLAGAAFGMCWPLLVLISGEVFGAANVGANYMFFDGFTSAAGTFLLSKVVAQAVYDGHIDDKTSPDQYTCLGMGCFQETHLTVAALAATCIGTSVALMATTRHIYHRQDRRHEH